MATKEAYASGVNIGFQSKTLNFFPMTSKPTEDGFDYTNVDAILTPQEAAQFKLDCWFAFKEAQRHGSGIIIDCIKKSVNPLWPADCEYDVIETISN